MNVKRHEDGGREDDNNINYNYNNNDGDAKNRR